MESRCSGWAASVNRCSPVRLLDLGAWEANLGLAICS